MPSLYPRDYYYDCYYDRYNNYVCRRNAWNDWVRWVVLVVVVLGFFLLFALCSCITARRRRKAGRNPFYGTGWMAPGNQPYTQQPYYNNQYGQPAPPYSPQPQPNQPTYGYYNNQAPYGQQQGVELQTPQPTYHNPGADNVYTPPPGPPPNKSDGIVR